MLTWVNIVDFGFGCFDCLEDENVLECLLSYGPYMWDGGENLDLLGFPFWYDRMCGVMLGLISTLIIMGYHRAKSTFYVNSQSFRSMGKYRAKVGKCQ